MKEQPPELEGAFREVVRQLTTTPRRCGTCQLCCRLLPVEELGKRHNTRCKHQRHAKGCAIYAKRPVSCALWNCHWLEGAPLQRPDHGHYVVDTMLDTIATTDNETGEKLYYDCAQVWIDPAYPEAWRCHQLAAFLEAKRIPAIVRLKVGLGFTLWPPSISADGQWHQTDVQLANARQGELQAEREAMKRV